uniref:RING-type E3 ubiquitin transferase n=1 Tax=Arion vulgaris TaxID=1028688 RepID=A0A0B6ZTG1_9EUPU
MHLVGAAVPEQEKEAIKTVSDNPKSYEQARKCIEDMAVHLKPLAENTSDDDSSTCSDPSLSINNGNSIMGSGGNINISKCVLSRPMQRKLISLIHCQLLEEEGRSRAARIARSLGERIVSELLVLHQYPHQLSANLWAAVRTRGCQFLGPAMQEEVLKLILLALEDGSFLSRKVLVLFVVQRLESRYPQASKTAIGHVVQLLYRASCFKVLKRDEESSLMQLKEEFYQYEALRREHDSQIVQIALEAGLRISPEQWSSLLYGDPAHKSHMQSIIDKHQSPQSFAQSVTELMLTLQRSADNVGLLNLQPQLEFLSSIDPSPDCPAPSWENLEAVMRSLNTVMTSFVEFLSNPEHRSRIEVTPVQNTRYKTSMCRDFSARGMCPRANTCTFAHSQEELERYRSRSRRNGSRGTLGMSEKSSSISPLESDQFHQVHLISNQNVTESVGKNPGNTQSFVEMIDRKSFVSSPVQDLTPVFNALSLSQQQMAGVMHPKLTPGYGEFHGNKHMDPEKPPFIASASQFITETRLTFSCPFDSPDNTSIPAFAAQSCFLPNSQTTYPHNPLLQNPVTHSPSIRPQMSFVPPQGTHLMAQSQYSAFSQTVPPSHQIQNGSVGNGPNIGIHGVSSLPLQPSGDLSLAPVNMTAQQTADTSIILNGCIPCMQIQPVERSQMVQYPIQTFSQTIAEVPPQQIIPVYPVPADTPVVSNNPYEQFAHPDPNNRVIFWTPICVPEEMGSEFCEC